MKLADFDVLTFDCYGTLIDWEGGIHTALGPLLWRAGIPLDGGAASPAGEGLPRAGVTWSRNAVLEAFARVEVRQQENTPGMIYSDLLAEVHGQLAAEFAVAPDPAEAAEFGASIADWPAFPDTVEALGYLRRHFRLVILSNVDRASFQETSKRLGVTFDAVHTAQEIGSYKPDPRNFDYLLDRLKQQGFARQKILHVAQSLFHDHVPAKAIGLASAWIDRRSDAGGWGATAPVTAEVSYDFRFTSLGQLARSHRAGE
ncbi:HAD-IA family hydrolase [Rhodopila sp.]|uniref:HAD-IA family hydrolase n=1 Tax=Rhodopila sp. TaxID=2480087 RepID=UPI003D0A5C13